MFQRRLHVSGSIDLMFDYITLRRLNVATAYTTTVRLATLWRARHKSSVYLPNTVLYKLLPLITTAAAAAAATAIALVCSFS